MGNVFMRRKNILIILLVALPIVLLALLRYKERRNTERNLSSATQTNMERILVLAKEYNQRDPYFLYLMRFKEPEEVRIDPYLFMDWQCAISDKPGDWNHYYTSMHMFADAEVKGQPLSRAEFEKANDFLIFSDAQDNVFIYNKISNTFYPKLNGRQE